MALSRVFNAIIIQYPRAPGLIFTDKLYEAKLVYHFFCYGFVMALGRRPIERYQVQCTLKNYLLACL